MIKITSSACINANIEDTWKTLSEVDNIYMWSEPVEKSFCSGKITRGIGTERTCILKGNITINEKWIDWNEGKSFTYIGYNLPFVRFAKNTWTVISKNHKTLLTSQAEIEVKGGFIGIAFEPILHFMTRRMGANAMAAFKYLVEEGKPYKGKHSSLARAPFTC